MDLSNADHRMRFPVRVFNTNRTCQPARHADRLGPTGFQGSRSRGQSRDRVMGFSDVSLVLLLSFKFHLGHHFVYLGLPPPNLILRLCGGHRSSVTYVPICGSCRARRRKGLVRRLHSMWAFVSRQSHNNRGDETESGGQSVARLFFYNSISPLRGIISPYDRHWLDCLDSSQPPPPIFGISGAIIPRFAFDPQLS